MAQAKRPTPSLEALPDAGGRRHCVASGALRSTGESAGPVLAIVCAVVTCAVLARACGRASGIALMIALGPVADVFSAVSDRNQNGHRSGRRGASRC